MAIVRLVVHEVHATVLIRARGFVWLAAQQGNAFSPLDLHEQLQAFESIQAIPPRFPTGQPSGLSITSTLRSPNCGRLSTMSRML